MSDLKAKVHQKSISSGVLLQTPLGRLQRFLGLLAGFKGPTFNGGEGKGKQWEGERGE